MSLEKTGKEKIRSILASAGELLGLGLILFMFWALMLAGHAIGLE